MENPTLQHKGLNRILLFWLILIASVTSVQAQTISGTVRSVTDNQPLTGVTVHVNNKGTTTNAKDYYQLSGISSSDNRTIAPRLN